MTAQSETPEAAHAILPGELRGVARAMEIVDFRAREPDLDLTPSACRAIVKDAIKALEESHARGREAGLREAHSWQPIGTAPITMPEGRPAYWMLVAGGKIHTITIACRESDGTWSSLSGEPLGQPAYWQALPATPEEALIPKSAEVE